MKSEKPDKVDYRFTFWFRRIIEESGLAQNRIAEAAKMTPEQLSRVMNGYFGTSKKNAVKLINAINTLAGKEVADKEKGLEMCYGNLPEKKIKVERVIDKTPFTIEFEEGMGLDEAVSRVEVILVKKALEWAGNNQVRAAKYLKIPVHSVRYFVKKHNLLPKEKAEKD